MQQRPFKSEGGPVSDKPAGPTPEFWQQRFAAQHTPWDRAAVNPALEALLAAGLIGAGARVLVPGCGAGHEVARLAAAGCRVQAVDYTPQAVALTRQRLAQAGLAAEVVEADLLSWTPDAAWGGFDLVWEQACLCALHPDRWAEYAVRLARWVVPGGTLVLLAMQVERDGRREGRVEGPPYHCDVNAMRALFAAPAWDWPPPPYARLAHPSGTAELQIVLRRAPAAAA